MPRKLKVYRTPIGFHDAYVAAPSQKAALEAWGTDANLFARGIAELVTDDELTGEPLASPGKVIKRLRGSAAEQLAALQPNRPKREKTVLANEGEKPAAALKKRARAEVRTKPNPRPRPTRAALDQAEEQLRNLIEHQDAAEQAMEERERALARERRELEKAQARARRAAERKVEEERRKHSDALARWIEEQS